MLQEITEKLRKGNKYGKEKLIVLTPIHRESEGTLINDWDMPVSASLIDYVKREIDISKLLGIKYIDLYSLLCLNPKDQGNKAMYFCEDGLHPNDSGHKQIAEFIYQSFKKMLL